MILAELTGQDWVLIISALGTVIIVPVALQVTGMILSYLRDRDAREDRQEVKRKADETLRVTEEVKNINQAQTLKLETVVRDVEEIKNS